MRNGDLTSADLRIKQAWCRAHAIPLKHCIAGEAEYRCPQWAGYLWHYIESRYPELASELAKRALRDPEIASAIIAIAPTGECDLLFELIKMKGH